MKFLNFLRGETFARGIHPPQHKYTARTPIRRLPYARQLIVPLSQHIGRAPRAIVRVGQEVVRGELIAKAEDWLSVPHHSPATGVVQAIELRPTARGPWTESIVIRPHAAATQEDLWGQPRDTAALSPDEILQAVWDSGMVGLGGAAFPTHAKLKVPKQAQVHTLVVNGCECEPYLTCDHRVMLEEAPALITGVRLAMRATGAVRSIIGVEDNKLDAVAAIQAAIDAVAAEDIFVEAVPTKYPQGSEKMLLMSLFGVEIPSGQLPVSLGMVMNNVGTLAAIGRLLPAGQGLTERVITIAGPGVARPGDYRVPLGTPISFVLEWAGAPMNGATSACQLVLGGPMMGQSVAALDTPITKGVSGVLLFQRQDMADRDGRVTYPCIKCGECVESCPMGLNPSTLGRLAAKREYEEMGARYHLGDCFECGCCTYICPSNIPLVQQFRVAKQVLREQAASAPATPAASKP
ncbi:MAG: electron transport complex subunit RsxC [Rubrivivax sp.]|jgi:electron transport complex protein RnfC|nr:electron transport complex subunit RsxC [Rubrivivax sp.]